MGRQLTYTKEKLEDAVRTSKSWMEVQRKLGLKVGGGNHQYLQSKARLWSVDASHFTGQLWNKGLTRTDHPSIDRAARTSEFSDEQVFVENSPVTWSTSLKRRLLRNGWEYKCQSCGINEWNGKPLTLHLDHINGIHNDNREENLRFLCPNCHQQTPTWGNGRHRKAT